MSQRAVLVTGGSSGIGLATALKLAERGDHLVLAARSDDALAAAADRCRAAGAGSVTTDRLDVRHREHVQSAVDRLVIRHGRLDAVVHSAGVVAYGRFEDIPADVHDAVLYTNVLGAANVARAALRQFRLQQHGSLVFIGSVLGDIAVPMMTPYVVSKYAIRSLGRQLTLENRDLPDVHITVLSPGSVDTPIYQQAANYLGRPGRPSAPVASATRVADTVVRALDKPRDRVGVGMANGVMRLGFTFLPRVFDALVGPLFQLSATKPEHLPPTSGNVLRPNPAREHIEGAEGQGSSDLVSRLKGR